MANAFIISEYVWQGHKQLLLERVQGEDASYYRVIIVKRCSTLDAAKEAYLQEIPEKRQDYHKKKIADYAAKHNIKQDAPAPAKGRQNAKSKQNAV